MRNKFGIEKTKIVIGNLDWKVINLETEVKYSI